VADLQLVRVGDVGRRLYCVHGCFHGNSASTKRVVGVALGDAHGFMRRIRDVWAPFLESERATQAGYKMGKKGPRGGSALMAVRMVVSIIWFGTSRGTWFTWYAWSRPARGGQQPAHGDPTPR
jgi:hypothetical protein